MTHFVSGALRSAGLAAALLLAPLPALGQEAINGSTLDGATFSLPSVWVIGEPLVVTGTNWVTLAGNWGSTIGVKYDFGDVVPSEPLDEIDDVWARIQAARDGSFTAELPYPAEAGWEAGETHTIHLLTGALGDNDQIRNPTLRVTIVAAD